MRSEFTHVLIIEDNAGDARLLQEMFRDSGATGIELTVTSSMDEAEAHLAANAVDAILLDLGLPGYEGLGALQRAHEVAPAIPLVVLTGLDDETTAIAALQQGAQDYLIKGQIESVGLTRALRYAIERKNMEAARASHVAALATSEASLRGLLESNITGVVYWNMSGAILNANELFLSMVGYTREELEQGLLQWTALTPPEYAAADARAMAEVSAHRSCSPYEKEFIRKDGARITVMVGSALLTGETERGSSFIMDITDRKLNERRVRLQSIALNAADHAMLIMTNDQSIVWVNPAFTTLTGYSEEEAIGSKPQTLLRSGVHEPEFYENITNTIREGHTWRGEMINRRKDGQHYAESQTITPVKDEQGAITHFISIRTDLTAQRLIESQLRQAQKMEAVGQLAAGVAHEFNNLLQALMSMAAIMRLRGGSTEVAKLGTDMEFQIKRGANLTQQLLLFSQRHNITRTNIDLGEQVEKAGALLRQLIPQTIRIVIETSPSGLAVEGDAGQMQQVLLNLAINARDAMPDGGTLTLRATSGQDQVFLEVEDTGTGVDEATRAHLFEPFFTTKENGKGTGLGLAVVHGIVEEHGGRIDVQSSPGEGSRFRLILPAATGVLPAGTVDVNADFPTGSGKVLLVEDQIEIREAIGSLLEMIGYVVTAVSSGEEALDLPSTEAPDVLLSDVTLAGVGGSTLGDRLHERWPALKVVLMSGHIEEAVRANATERGWRFLQKPFELSELASALRATLADPVAV